MNIKEEQYINHSLHQRLINEVEKLPEPLQRYFSAKAIEQCRSIPSQDLQNLQHALQISLTDLCLMLLPVAAAYAETPISAFNVGAIVIDEYGDLYFGANFEFSHTNMAQTIHAEQSAIAHAWMSGGGALTLLVVNYPPCGHCRQFINETKRTEAFKIQLPEHQAQPFAYYLPEAFGPDDLAVSARILGKNEATQYNLQASSKQLDENDLKAHAKRAMLLSHSPYSHSESGIALRYEDGQIVTGSYGENAAFNPSLPPLQVALNYRRMTARKWQLGLKEACLFERVANMSQLANTQSLLQTFSDCVLDYQSVDN